MKKVLYTALIVLTGLFSSANVNDYTFEQINANMGITFNAITDICADQYGFLWFSCSNGLYYYNSSEIQKYNFENSKSDPFVSTEIRYIFKDRFKKLWILTRGDIGYFNEDENRFCRVNFTNENTEVLVYHPHNFIQLKNETYLILINGSIYSFTQSDLKLNRLPITESNLIINHFTVDEMDNVYATANNSLYKFNSDVSSFDKIYEFKSSDINRITLINNKIWVGFVNNGVEVISKQGNLVTSYSEKLKGKNYINNNRIRSIISGPDNEVWLGTFDGISVITNDTTYNIAENPKNGLPHQGVFHLLKDENDGIWASTWSGGLAYYNKYNYKFPHIKEKETKKTPWNTVVSDFTEDKNGNIWIGSENQGLMKYTPQKSTFLSTPKLPISRIKSLSSDNNNTLWIGTLYEGLWKSDGQSIKRIGNIEGIFNTVLATNKGVWVGAKGVGVYFYDKREDKIYNYTHDPQDPNSICSKGIWNIFEDSKGNIWFSSDFGISVKRKGSEIFENYLISSERHNLRTNLNYSIAEDRKGNIWFGTGGKGIDIYDPNTKIFKKFEQNKEIEDADVYCILRDKDDNMWFSSSHGVYAYYHNTKTLKHFSKEDGLQDQQYHPNSGYVSKEGILYFGGGNGFNIIDPHNVHPNTIISDIYLSKLQINNKTIDQLPPKYINSNYLPAVNSLKLNYKQNSISFAFVSNSYIKNSKSKFNYRLLNYMDEWTKADYNSNISFIKIPPGKYTLQVEFLNSDGLANAPLKEIEINISHPFWFKWYAFVLYIVLIETIVIIAFREMRFRAKSEIDQTLFTEKVKFFTNVSHEFRTPLTLIISPINTLTKRFINEPETLDSLKIIQRNADRLLRLTNQILDFRLIEINSVKLKREEVDLIKTCKNVYDCFEYQIKEKEINCIFKSSFKSFNLYLDPEKIEKVIYNILSNALKYSIEKGQIIVSIETNNLTKSSYNDVFTTGHQLIGDVLEIKIKDNGKGIDKSIVNHIFDRFYVDQNNNETGTGIGLHICQEYIKLHNGNIMVYSEPGKETTFTINIPIETESKFEQEDIILQTFFDHAPDHINEEEAKSSGSKPMILFAEDNNDLRKYYKEILSNRYKVITAKNGTQAFEIASELSPNLIISDILMPGMDGMSLTEQIRNTDKIKHIPIILLTALRDDKFKIESMHKGANAFLTKPVEEELLIANIENIFNNTNIIKNHYKGDENTSATAIGKNDTFIEEVERIVEKNLQNYSFEITELATQIGISRSSLQRKIKKTVNMSPSEFIREVRLKKAVILLKKDKYNIDEIAIMVGFNSTSYFIRSFKKKYEITPTAFRQSVDKQKDI